MSLRIRATMIALFLCAAVAVRAQDTGTAWKDQGVLHLVNSPQARLRNVPVRAVTLSDGFWSKRRQTNVEKSIPTLLELLEVNGIVDNFRRLSGKDAERKGPLYTDSDLYKWMEAAAFVLQSQDHVELRQKMEELTDIILAAQEESGYLNTYYQDDRRDLRWTEQHRGHELYCLGHLVQAAIAYYRATGERRLLDGAIRFVDHLAETSGPGKRPLLTGHPELELALVELYRVTGRREHLELAHYLLTGDDRIGVDSRQIVYMFSGKPFPERTQLEGHAVRAMYACSGATDYYLESGDEAYWKTIEHLWRDMVTGKMYITGGVGSRAAGEAFGEPYELPNRRAYTESCAAIGNYFWNWRLLAATGEAKYADLLERALYNGINSGMSINGTLYCYRNPLELSGDPEDKIRNPWYNTTCCPPNLQRVFASLPGYFYSTSEDGIYVHLYDNNTLDWKLQDGTGIKVTQETHYPWQGLVDLTVSPEKPAEFTLYLRIPGWSENTRVAVNTEELANKPRPGEYLALRRQWKDGDTVSLLLDLGPRLTTANPLVRENAGRAAVERGPVVYAMEGLDNPQAPSLFDARLAISGEPGAGFSAQFMPDMLGGIVVLRHRGLTPDVPAAQLPLYERLTLLTKPKLSEMPLALIPYYAFANREPTPMEVWIPYEVQ